MLSKDYLTTYKNYQQAFMSETYGMAHDLQFRYVKKVDRILNNYIKKYCKYPEVDILNRSLKLITHNYLKKHPDPIRAGSGVKVGLRYYQELYSDVQLNKRQAIEEKTKAKGMKSHGKTRL